MPFLALPNEILLLVLENLERERDIYALLRTNNRTYSLAIDCLYQRNINRTGGSALVWCSRKGYGNCVRQLLALNADVNIQDRDGYSPLMRAAQSGCPITTGLLVHYGASLRKGGPSLSSPLHHACNSGNESVVKMLLEYGDDINSVNLFGYTPLHVAAAMNHTAVVNLLLECGADVNLSRMDDPGNGYGNGTTPLHSAAGLADQSITLLDLLIHWGAGLENVTRTGETPLHFAARAGSSEKVRFLLARGAHVDAKANSGQTPLHIAASEGKVSVTELLLKNGADISLKDNRGLTPCATSHYERLSYHFNVVA